MNLSITNKVLLGVAIMLAAGVAGTVHWWIGFAIVVVGFAVLLLLVRIDIQSRQRDASTAAAMPSPMASDAWHDHRRQMVEEMRRLEEDLGTDPINKRFPGNIWRHLE